MSRRPVFRALPGRLRAGIVLAAAGLLVATAGPWVVPADPHAVAPAGGALLPPSWAHPFGTDPLGRDVFARVVIGGRASLLVGWTSVALALLLGTLVGVAAGAGPRWLDRLLMGLTDVFLAVPRLFLVLLLSALLAPSLLLVVVVLGLTGWMGIARLVRAEILALREREFVLAARGLGLRGWRLARRHLLPHVVPTLLVAAALRLGGTILLESFLSYLGLGAQEPTVTWGAMIEQGRGYLVDAWWITTFPGVALTVTVVAYNLLADGLRDLADPRRPREEVADERFPAVRP